MIDTRHHPDEGDREITDLLPEIEALIDQGATIYLKWTCPACGERCVADEPNKYHVRGYLHTERDDGTSCGTWYHGTRFGYLLIASCVTGTYDREKQEVTISANGPEVKLIGEDGNAFAILGRCRRAAKKAGWTDDEWQRFQREATSGDYDHLLATVMEWFDVS